jgi:hypothetical protein
MTAGFGAVGEFGQEPRLPDSRLAVNLYSRRAGAFDRGDEVVEHAEFLGSPNQIFGNGHSWRP